MAAKAIKRKVSVVPNSLDEATKMVVRIRQLERQIELIQQSSSVHIRKLEVQIVEKLEETKNSTRTMQEERDKLSEAVFIFAQERKMELTDNLKKKTVELPTGDKLRWYFANPSVAVEDEEKAVAELKEKGLQEFIRTKEEINKEAILAKPGKTENLRFISVIQDEIFSIVLAMQKMEFKEPKKFKTN